MAYHNSTPESVLNAPKFQPVYFVMYTAPNRAQRRGRQYIKPGPDTKYGRNVPYVKPKGEGK